VAHARGGGERVEGEDELREPERDRDPRDRGLDPGRYDEAFAGLALVQTRKALRLDGAGSGSEGSAGGWRRGGVGGVRLASFHGPLFQVYFRDSFLLML
jgi:hypothetical protein